MSLSLLNDIILRVVVDPNFVTKGSELTFVELDSNIKIITDAIREITQQDVSGVEAYNAGTEYSLGDFVSFSGNIWEYINAVPQTGVTPSSDPLTWQLSSTGAFAHQQNKDQFLDEGGPNEVSAADLAALVAGFSAPYGRLIYVDGEEGDDGTALVGSPLNPFLTLTAAKTAAVSGDLIIVNPSTYNEKNLLKDGVNWFFHLGAEVVYTGGSDGAIFDDDAVTGSNGAVTCTILGDGVFDRQGTGNGGSFKGGVYLTNNSNNIIIRAKKLAANVNVFHLLGDLNKLDVVTTASIENVDTWGIFHNEGNDLNARIVTKDFVSVDATTEQFFYNDGDDSTIHIEAELYSVAGTGSTNPDIEVLGVNSEITFKGFFVNYVPVAIGVNRWEVSGTTTVKFVDIHTEDILETILISGGSDCTFQNCELALARIFLDTSGTTLLLKDSVVQILGSPVAVEITTAQLVIQNSTIQNILGAPATHAIRFVDQGAQVTVLGVSFVLASGAFSSLSFDGNHGGTSNQINIAGQLYVNRPLGGTTLSTTTGGGLFVDTQAGLSRLTYAQAPNLFLKTDANGNIITSPSSASESYANVFFNGANATDTVITTQNVPVKVLGTTTLGENGNGFTDDGGVSNRIKNETGVTKKVRIIVALSILKVGGGPAQGYVLYIAKNGTVLTGSGQRVGANNTSRLNVPLTFITEMLNNDYVEVWVENAESTSNALITRLSFNATEILV